MKRVLANYARDLFKQYPVVTITGPRQSGKTTMCKEVFAELPYFNLEDLEIRAYAKEDPKGFLSQCKEGALLDEIQNVPELTSYIQVMVDDMNRNSLFVLTGSQQFEIIEAVSQSLAGRTAILKLLPFAIEELSAVDQNVPIDNLLYSGFFPRIFDQKIEPSQVLSDYFLTYIERDIRKITKVQNLTLFQRFVKLCAGRVGQLLNINLLCADTGVSHATGREWLSLMQASFTIFLLPPYFQNINKRLIKSPKLYFYDVGLAAHLLGVENATHITHHPLRGNLFENLVVLEVLKYRYNRVKSNNLYFFRDSKGNEIDLFTMVAHQVIAIEIKSGATLNSSYYKGFNYLDTISQLEVLKKILIYNGDISTEIHGIQPAQPKDIPAVLDAMMLS